MDDNKSIISMNKICKIIPFLNCRGVLNWLNDEVFLRLTYRAMMGKKLNLKNPQLYNEKLQWIKLYDRNPRYTNLVDKYEVRKYVKDLIGEEYLVPLIGIYNDFDDIDFNTMPNKFVLKCTHDSGGIVICKDKNNFDKDNAKKIINKSLQRNYYYVSREWPYKNVKPRIICEELLETEDGNLPVDYKFHCFNGEVDNVMVCVDRESGKPKFYFFDKMWNLLRYNIAGKNASEDFTIPKPNLMETMFDIAEKLSKELLFVRVDLYCENNKIYFGELTFFPESGFDANLLEETDLLFGNKIIL